LTAFEASRVPFRLDCDVRVYDPTGLPVKDDVQHQHPKVQEQRDLSRWSDGHVWVSPEQHGNLVCVSDRSFDHVSPLPFPFGHPSFSHAPNMKQTSCLRYAADAYFGDLTFRPRVLDRSVQGPNRLGSPSPPAPSAQPKAAPSPLPKYPAARSPSTQSICCACSAAGCACSPFPTNLRFQRRTRSSQMEETARGRAG